MNSYLWLGISLAAMAGFFLLLLVAWASWVRERRKEIPAYSKRLPAVRYGDVEKNIFRDSYRAAGSIEGMLRVAAEKIPGHRERRCLRAALSYLEESRYKDYETALYAYASDGTQECRGLFQDMLEMEIRKRRGLLKK